MTPLSIPQLECYEAAMLFAKTEGIIIAPETSHAVAATIRKAKEAKEEGRERVIIFNLSGHGLMDLNGYDKFIHGKLADHELTKTEIDHALEELKAHPKAEMRKTGKW